MRADNRI